MGTLNRGMKAGAVLALSLTLLACAATPQKSDGNGGAYSALYDGESTAAFGTSFPAGSPAEAKARGDAAAKAGDWDRALFEYIRGLEMAEEPSPAVLYRIGAIHDRRGNAELAEAAYRWALRVEPKEHSARIALGILRLRQRAYGEARQALETAVDEGARSWRAQNALGVLADLDSRFAAAKKHYENALEINAGSAVILNNLGYSRYLAGDWSGAREALERALAADAEHKLAWRNLGLVHVREGRYEEALAAFRHTQPSAEAYNDMGYVAMLDGDAEMAARLFDEAMRVSPTFYETASENATRVRGRMDDSEHGRESAR